MKHEKISSEYQHEFEKPLERIQEDLFFRADNFRQEPWYNEFLLYTRIGSCQPAPEHVLEVQKALKLMGYPTHTAEHNGKVYIMPGDTHIEKYRTPDPRDEG